MQQSHAVGRFRGVPADGANRPDALPQAPPAVLTVLGCFQERRELGDDRAQAERKPRERVRIKRQDPPSAAREQTRNGRGDDRLAGTTLAAEGSVETALRQQGRFRFRSMPPLNR